VNINHFPKFPLPDFSKLLSHISKTFQSSKKTGSNLHVNRLKSDSKVKQGKKCARKEKSPRRAKNTQFSGFGFCLIFLLLQVHQSTRRDVKD